MTRLIVVTLLLAAVAVVLKLRTRTTTITRTIKVTSRVSLNRGSMVAVVEVDGRRLLVGAAANNVTLLTELNESDAIDDLPVPDTSLLTPTAIFRSTSTAKPATVLIEKARQITTRTADAKLRLPHRQSGAA